MSCFGGQAQVLDLWMELAKPQESCTCLAQVCSWLGCMLASNVTGHSTMRMLVALGYPSPKAAADMQMLQSALMLL